MPDNFWMLGEVFQTAQKPVSPSFFYDKSNECPYSHDLHIKKGAVEKLHKKFCTCSCAWCIKKKILTDGK